MALEIFLRRFF